MIRLKIKFKISHKGDKDGYIYYQISDNKKIKYIDTEYRLQSNEWNRRKTCPILIFADEKRKQYLLSINEKIKKDIYELEEIILSLQHKKLNFDADDVIRKYSNLKKDKFLFSFMERIIQQIRVVGKIRTSETYTVTLNSFMRFREGKDIPIEDITSELIYSYETWLKSKGVSMNTISFYMRILRAVNNRAVEEGIVEQRYPFKSAYTGYEKTTKRAISINTIKTIKNMDYPLGSRLAFARDMFMFSFYTRGMSFVDMAFLQKSDLNNGILSYRRQKTGQRLFIRWESCMQELVDRHSKIDTPYLLPLIRKPGENERKQYLNESHRISRNLKVIGKSLGLSTPLTMYVARHTWASVAKSKNIPISVISESMGHSSETTTQIYLSSLDKSQIDEANRLIINSL